MLTCYPFLSFLDRDTLMRHFGCGIGHQEFARLSEIEPQTAPVEEEESITEEEDADVDVNMEDDEEDEGDDLGDEGSASDHSSNDTSDGYGGDESDDNGYASF